MMLRCFLKDLFLFIDLIDITPSLLLKYNLRHFIYSCYFRVYFKMECKNEN